ncbi:MAG TPA: glycosyltransferase family 4 protein [Chloroflexota bacterium]|nr:glycosyltransferase family 4 protein [Chloroflexota bacterium]
MTHPLRILTWHVHGSYLLYLSQCPHEFFLPVKSGRPHGYGGRSGPFPWPDNVYEVDAADLRSLTFDCILFQTSQHFLEDQYDLLTRDQRRLPRIYLEHDPPQAHPTNTRHIVNDPDVLLVHVTHYNRLMWDCGRTPTRVVEHGVFVSEQARYSGELSRGIAVVNHLARRGRRLGEDVFREMRRRAPIDLVGMAAEESDGLGEVPFDQLHVLLGRYRFYFHPVRYTSLGLAACEAMMIGMPIVGLATTELATVITNGAEGYVSAKFDDLADAMSALLDDRALATRMGAQARQLAMERFGIDRFVADWCDVFATVTGRRDSPRPARERRSMVDHALKMGPLGAAV